MAKTGYKIPTSINQSWLDQEINLSTKSIQISPLPLKVVGWWIVMIFLGFWIVTQTFVQYADWWLQLLMVIWLGATAAVLGGYSKTKQMKVEQLPALMEYLPPSNRRISTRRDTQATKFASLVGVRQISDDGQVTFMDGDVGHGFLVVGSASTLLFEDDLRAIINRVDKYWRKAEVGSEHLTITTKEAQRVHRQVAHLERLNLGLQVRDPELRELMDEQYNVLTTYVGETFTSIHQYLFLRAANIEELRRMNSILVGEIESSSLMIKQCTPLRKMEMLSLLRVLYTPQPV